MKVLLVDDSLVDRMILESFLQDLGHELVIGENGAQAVELYKEHSPDLVIMDEVMPVMKGQDAARKIREIEDNWTPIIFLSACFSAEDIAAGIEAGADDYLAKPIDHKTLSAKMMAMQRIATMRSKLIQITRDYEEANEHLKKLVDIDGLTGIANRRYLDRYLAHEVARCQRSAQSLTVIMCDVDHFKAYNDFYGHLQGDDCLKSVANALGTVSRRTTDLVARYGGEEFAVMMVGVEREDVRAIAESIRLAVMDLAIPHAKSSIADVVTLSVGVFVDVPKIGTTPSDFLKRADAALYQAKQSGRNKVHFSEDFLPEE
ncbi:MAG: diguanylate cyclase [Pseudomonadales bacterium]|nr:diguanylate cyclase [Pseudomonadales bacterium]